MTEKAILIAMDSFKGSLTSAEANQAAKEGIHLIDPSQPVKTIEVADGGEGTVRALTHPFSLTPRLVTVENAIGEMVTATYGLNRQSKTAVIEVAEACGLPQLQAWRLQPVTATSYGVGQIILDAVEQGCRSLYLGLGGSATTDGGTGMLRALGFRFFDESEQEITTGGQMHKIIRSDAANVPASLQDCTFTIICDVDNPFHGKKGAAHIYARQKGANARDILQLDHGLKQFAQVILQEISMDLQQFPGSGAAGGIGGACFAFLNGRFEPGADLILTANQIHSTMSDYALVLSGEGRIDHQTLHGKLPMSLGSLASAHRIPMIVFGGKIDIHASQLQTAGITSAHSITPGPATLEEMMVRDMAFQSLKNTVANCYALWRSSN